MAKIVAIVSSPEKGANTDTLVAKAAEGAEKKGYEVETFHLNQLANKKGCISCYGCKKNPGKCHVKDDLSPILEAIRGADGVILSTPVYFGQACSQYRTLEDRFFSFLDGTFTPTIEPKKFAVIVSAGTAGADKEADRIEGIMTSFFKFQCVGKLSVITGNDVAHSSKDADLLAQAEALGEKF